MTERAKSDLDCYLIEATSAKNISTAIDKCVDIFGVSRSTVHRWRRLGKINDAVSIARILIEITKLRRKLDPPKPIPTLKDLIILCGYGERKNNE